MRSMSTVVAFPAGRRRSVARSSGEGQALELKGPVVVILPVVRIERHGEEQCEQMPPLGAPAMEVQSRKVR